MEKKLGEVIDTIEKLNKINNKFKEIIMDHKCFIDDYQRYLTNKMDQNLIGQTQ